MLPKITAIIWALWATNAALRRCYSRPMEMLTFQKFSASMQPAGNHAINTDESIGYSLYEQDKIIAVGDR